MARKRSYFTAQWSREGKRPRRRISYHRGSFYDVGTASRVRRRAGRQRCCRQAPAWVAAWRGIVLLAAWDLATVFNSCRRSCCCRGRDGFFLIILERGAAQDQRPERLRGKETPSLHYARVGKTKKMKEKRSLTMESTTNARQKSSNLATMSFSPRLRTL